MVAAENAARNSPTVSDSTPAVEQTLSREQIAQSLAGKDPSWFRQTADANRGAGAFRKNQVEDQDTVEMPVARTQLPGMSRGLTAESSKEAAARPVTPTTTRPSQLGSPLSLSTAQRLDPPAAENAGDDTASARQSVTSPTGRTSPTRPVSPTKGMGGFVQSAMMKRSDSVKRWSVNSPSGLQRADSTRSSFSGLDNATQRTPKSSARPKSMLREGSSTPALAADAEEEKDKEELKIHSDADTTTADSIALAETNNNDEDGHTLPTSPSKTMDPRRWSPTKSSSWLEAALNKPESPKAKPAPAPSAQPAWMVELNKAKAQKASADLARSVSLPPKKPEVKTGGLIRSTPMGSGLKPSALGNFPTVPPVSTTEKPAIGAFRTSLRKASPTSEEPSESLADPAPLTKTKPETPPKKDFRTNLKSRAPPPGPKSTEAADELKNVFGNLRRTKTQNYKAPDELKDNILRGKAALSLTGGPKKSERKDEFKDAILKKKDDFKQAQQEGRGVTRGASSASEKSLPEGIAKKLELQRTGTFSRQTPTSPDFGTGSNRSSDISTNSKHDITSQSAEALMSSPDLTKATTSPAFAPPVQKAASAPSRVPGKVGGLADRFNPALAGLLARGPPGSSGPNSSAASSATGTPALKEPSEPAGPGPQLTHMTKNRARGPRRKAPTSVAKSATEPDKGAEPVPQPEKKPITSMRPEPVSLPKSEPVASKAEKPVISPKPNKFTAPPETISLVQRRKSVIQDRLNLSNEVLSHIETAKRAAHDEPKSANQQTPTPIKTRPRSPTKVHEQVAALAALTQQSPKPAAEPAGDVSQPSSPRKLDMKRMSRFFDEQNQASVAKVLEPVKPKASSPVKERFPAFDAPVVVEKQGGEQPELKPALPIRGAAPFGGVGLGVSQAGAPPVEKPAPKPVVERPLPKSVERASPPVVEKPAPKSFFERPLPQPAVEKPAPPPVEKPTPKSYFERTLPQFGFEKPAPKPTFERPLPKPVERVIPPPVEKPSPKSYFDLPLPQPAVEKPAPQPVEKPAPKSYFDRPLPTQPTEKPLETERPPPPRQSNPPLPSLPPSPHPNHLPANPLPTRSPKQPSSDIPSLITEFFGPERPRRKYTADAADLLMTRPVSTATVQTQHRVQLFQITSEGKKLAVPSHHERVLFEREMYVCPHVYLADGGRRKVVEVYFWAGDEVPESEVDDAHLFAAREARAIGGKLVKLTQGKETSEFVQALGGIVIVRRGSSIKYDSLAPTMLCGRRYLGQVAFDEVDFAPGGLCSGFAYLIAQQGKCFLWKGKGSDVEELGCARLVGMEMALMGELVEVEEGSEPESFWAMFGGGARLASADHWRLKPGYERYSGRLFCASAGDKQQVHHRNLPFAQSDLSPAHIYVLDAFFEMYIIVGARSQHQYAAFRNALDFAQRQRSGSGGSVSSSAGGQQQRPSGLKRARSLRIVPLTQALQALAE
ncbi:hypothetical protein N0V88_001612 [Collariella sp. IMI 366227]|nr:hypothetical protein N0V88_001612 [Collariella sp. IMI 366227]